MSILGAIGAVPVLIAPGGQTFTGAGFFRGYWLANTTIDPAASYTPEGDADFDLTAGAGKSSFALPMIPFSHRDGRMAWLADSVGLSGGGGNITVKFYVTGEKGNAV